jgi:hypothetical protein
MAHNVLQHNPDALVFIGGQGAGSHHKPNGVHFLQTNGLAAAEQIAALLTAKRTGP